MSFLFRHIFIFICILFNCTKSQDSQDYKFLFIIGDKTYEITVEDTDIGNEFKERIIEKKQITINMLYRVSSSSAILVFNKDFPKFNNLQKQEITTFKERGIIACSNSFLLINKEITSDNCNVIGSFNEALVSYKSNTSFDITFKAVKSTVESTVESKKDDISDNSKDIAPIKIVVITISITSLILLYYLLLLF